ncbi:hypothetical protein Shyhy02_42650 [Streptomyces hygroscopicus subsp. hygroscopicus]|nr:hypothetical protein Shyhy02_42650 [Streptomyces hygroscopicus subsp. hygroscopicus]
MDEVVTWPEMLVLRGGLGCWSFTRVDDMLDFFRPSPDSPRIEPVYWSEKPALGSGSEVEQYRRARPGLRAAGCGRRGRGRPMRSEAARGADTGASRGTMAVALLETPGVWPFATVRWWGAGHGRG